MKNTVVLFMTSLLASSLALRGYSQSQFFDFIGSNATFENASFSNDYTGEIHTITNETLNTNVTLYHGGSEIDVLSFTSLGDFLPIRNDSNQQSVTSVERFFAGEGNDILILSDNTFTLEDTIIVGGSGHDVLWANIGNDTIFGEGGNDIINGGPGNDDLEGNEGDDVIRGASGNDRLEAGTGNDILIGGTGDDQYWVGLDGPGESDINTIIESGDISFESNLIILDASIDEPMGGTANLDVMIDDVDLLVTILQNGTQFRVVDQFAGPHLKFDSVIYNEGNGLVFDLTPFVPPGPTTGDDTLFGTTASDTIDALTGNDTVDGLAGDDLLIGGPGADTLNGGEDNDTLFAGVAISGDYAADGTTNGGDLLAWQRSFGSTSDLQADGSGNGEVDAADLTIWQNHFGDAPTGGAGTAGDVLNGDAGNDLLIGNAGDNELNGGEGDDILLGYAGNDTLNGGVGNDTLQGDAGDDTLIMGKNLDVADGGAGQDTFVFQIADSERDLIEGFELGTDIIDLSGILIGYDPFITTVIEEFFAAFAPGDGNTDLYIDVDGFENGEEYTLFATLLGIEVDTFILDAQNSLRLDSSFTTAVPEPGACPLLLAMMFLASARRQRGGSHFRSPL